MILECALCRGHLSQCKRLDMPDRDSSVHLKTCHWPRFLFWSLPITSTLFHTNSDITHIEIHIQRNLNRNTNFCVTGGRWCLFVLIMYVWCVHVPGEARGGWWTAWNWSFSRVRYLWWVLGTELKFSERSQRTLSSCAITPDLWLHSLQCFYLNSKVYIKPQKCKTTSTKNYGTRSTVLSDFKATIPKEVKHWRKTDCGLERGPRNKTAQLGTRM